jgi:hypothetical protein
MISQTGAPPQATPAIRRLEKFSASTESENFSRSLFYRIFFTRTGSHWKML